MKRRQYAALVMNVLILALEVLGLVMSCQMMGAAMFQYFTQDSNYLALIACALYVFFWARYHLTGAAVPKWVGTLKYVAVCSLMLTFVVVVTVLIPINGNAEMLLFGGVMLYQHTLCPLLALLSFLLLEKDQPQPPRAVWFAMLPNGLYGLITLVLNILRKMDGPYPFLHVYSQPVWVSVMWFAAIFGGSFVMYMLIRRANARQRNVPAEGAGCR